MQFSVASAILAFVASASAHMDMSYPPPLRSKHNPYAGSDIDYSITSPLASQADYPCKGTLNLLGTSAATSVATWSAGGSYNMTIEGGANHNGGSCQASLSYDNGATFKVIQSYVGNCPVAGTSNLDFTIPSDVDSGDAIFAWTWFNNEGNREMYMNCAVVTIDSSSSKREAASTAFSARPDIFVANIGNGCTTVEGKDLEFPNPGPDVTDSGSNTAAPVGSCGSSSGGSTGGSSSVAASSAAASTVYGSPTAVASSVASAITSAAAAPTAGSGGVFIPSVDVSISSAAPTTLATATRAATSAAPAVTSIASSANGTVPAVTASGTTSAATSTGTATSGAYAVGSTCSDEGLWNCISGTSFQRCASGQWSSIITMSSGTSCTAGSSKAFAVNKRFFRI